MSEGNPIPHDFDSARRMATAIVSEVLLGSRPQLPNPQIRIPRRNFVKQVRSLDTEASRTFLQYVREGKIEIMIPMLRFAGEFFLIADACRVEQDGIPRVIALLDPQSWMHLEDARRNAAADNATDRFDAILKNRVNYTITESVRFAREIEEQDSSQRQN